MVSVEPGVPENKHPWSVLLVDDIPETAEFFAEKLREHFTRVTTSSPSRAVCIVERWKFDVLVTDLRFAGDKHIDNGIELVQRLNGHCPPTVLLTACVGAKILSTITSQAIHTDGTPLLRGAMKWGGIEKLRAQILGAMADAKQLPEWARAEGLKKIKIPEFNNWEATAELTNLIAVLSEKLKNYVRMTSEKIAILKEKYDLENWSSWQAIKQTIEWQLEQFATFNSERLIGRSEKDTLDAMHELNSRVIVLDISRIQPPEKLKNDEIGAILADLRGEHRDIESEIQEAFKRWEKCCNPSFDFDHDVERIFSRWKARLNIWYPNNETKKKSRFRDQWRLVTTLFSEIQKCFNDKSCEIDIRAVDNEDVWWEGSEEKEKLEKKIEWGGGYRLQIRINHYWDKSNRFFGKTYDQLLDPMRWTVEKLIAAKKIYIDPKQFTYTMEESGGWIEILLKTVEIDRKLLAQKEADAAKIQIKEIGTMKVDRDRAKVFRVTTPAGELTMIGCAMPKKMKKMDGTWSVIMHNGEIILAHMRAHFDNDIAFCHYLVKRLKLPLSEAYDLAENSLRLKLEEGRMFIAHEHAPAERLADIEDMFKQMWEPNKYQIREEIVAKMCPILEELGISNIILDPQEFYGRSGLMYMMVDYLEDPEMSRYGDDDEKDVWIDEVEK